MTPADGDAGRGELSLGPAGVERADDIAQLERTAFPDPWSAGEIETLLDSGAVIAFLATLPSGEAVAYALVQLLPDEGELLRIGVPPEQRRRGYARRLLAWIVEYLAADARPVVHLEVRTENRAARALYQGLGFEPVGLRQGYYSDGADAIRFRRGPAHAGG
jgi:ribosomal-protein-alanine N-acetyltransferase